MRARTVRGGIGVAAAVCLALLSGCVDLDDAGLSRVSTEAKTALPKVSGDIAAACARQNLFFDDTPEKERAPGEKDQDCKPYRQLQDLLEKDQKVLLDYFDALGKLASNQPLGYDAAVDRNVSAIGANYSLTETETDLGKGAEGLLKTMANAATHRYRQKHLGEVMQQSDAAVKVLTVALKKAVTGDYKLLLDNEQSSMDQFYLGPMFAAKPTELLALILVQRQYGGDKAALKERQENAVAYGKVMDDLAALHAKLTEQSKQKANAGEMGKEIGPILQSLSGTLAKIKTK